MAIKTAWESIQGKGDSNARAFIARKAVNRQRDYPWGTNAQDIFAAITRKSPDDQQIQSIQIENIADPSMMFPAAQLRSKSLVVTEQALFDALGPAALHVSLSKGALADIKSAWTTIDASNRTVSVPRALLINRRGLLRNPLGT